MTALLQISRRLQQLKNFENRVVFDEVILICLGGGVFFRTRCIYASVDWTIIAKSWHL